MNNLEIDKEYNVKIINDDKNGNGVTRINNFVVFVPYSLKDEELLIRIIDIKKRYAIGKIISILNSSPQRIIPKCNKYLECGACSFLHTDYDYEINQKINYIANIFNTEITNIDVDMTEHYRNKATFHIKDNRIGYYSENSHELIDFDECVLSNDRINKVYNLLKKEDISKLESVIIRTTKNELLIKFLGDINYKNIINSIKVDSIYINDKNVYGKEYIIEEINNIKYSIYPDSFFQINPNGMIKLYDKVKEYAGKGNKLLDLYCGTGTIGIYLKDNYKEITGIEINKSSIKNANINKKINNISNINFILGDSKIAKESNYDTIIVDPPRIGLSKEVINYLNQSNSKIIYVSCNPDTLKRDIDLLNNYRLINLSIINMFPKTKHVESIAILEKI